MHSMYRSFAGFCFFLLFFSLSSFPLGTGDEEIRKKQNELERIRKEIESFEGRIKESERRESATLERLDDYDRQTTLLQTLIRSLREDEKKLREDIEETRKTTLELDEQVGFLKRNYANFVRSAYKYGRTHDLELLLTSRSLNQALIRSKYLRRFSNQRKGDIGKIEAKLHEIEQQNIILQAQLTRQRLVIEEKSKEEVRLQSRVRQRKEVLVDIRKNRKNFQKEIERKRIAAKDIEQLIAKLIEEEQKAELERTRAEALAESRIAVSVFDRNRGKLRWPVQGGKIAVPFGDQRHPVLKTVTQNTGIDISVPAGTEVYAVAPGEVSTIWWLPSFGNLVIVNHHDGFRTVYAHLSEIEIREGETVEEGTRIGKSGESLSGALVHFEVWKLKEKQDPEEWLRPQGVTQR